MSSSPISAAMPLTASSCAAAYCAPTSRPRADVMVRYAVPWSAEILAVVLRVATPPISRRSTTSTSRPARARSTAVSSPHRPAPNTSTSVCRSADTVGKTCDGRSPHSEPTCGDDGSWSGCIMWSPYPWQLDHNLGSARLPVGIALLEERPRPFLGVLGDGHLHAVVLAQELGFIGGQRERLAD